MQIVVHRGRYVCSRPFEAGTHIRCTGKQATRVFFGVPVREAQPIPCFDRLHNPGSRNLQYSVRAPNLPLLSGRLRNRSITNMDTRIVHK